jgi:hypothetical protein
MTSGHAPQRVADLHRYLVGFGKLRASTPMPAEFSEKLLKNCFKR